MSFLTILRLYSVVSIWLTSPKLPPSSTLAGRPALDLLSTPRVTSFISNLMPFFPPDLFLTSTLSFTKDPDPRLSNYSSCSCRRLCSYSLGLLPSFFLLFLLALLRPLCAYSTTLGSSTLSEGSDEELLDPVLGTPPPTDNPADV